MPAGNTKPTTSPLFQQLLITMGSCETMPSSLPCDEKLPEYDVVVVSERRPPTMPPTPEERFAFKNPALTQSEMLPRL